MIPIDLNNQGMSTMKTFSVYDGNTIDESFKSARITVLFAGHDADL